MNEVLSFPASLSKDSHLCLCMYVCSTEPDEALVPRIYRFRSDVVYEVSFISGDDTRVYAV